MLKFVSIILLSSSIVSCATVSNKSVLVDPGHTKAEVLATMGPPEDRQFRKSQEAWQYCSTGLAVDDYMIIWFENGLVTGMNSYKQQALGSCTGAFKSVNWESAPDATVEFRRR